MAEHDDEREPDPRVTLANERTLLAWIRTALALVAGGVGLVAFVPPLGTAAVNSTLGATLTLLGALASSLGYAAWRRNERALRRGLPLSRSALLPVLAFGVAAVAVAALVALLVPGAA